MELASHWVRRRPRRLLRKNRREAATAAAMGPLRRRADRRRRIAMFAMVALASVSVAAQQGAPELERTPWGAPDLRGVWDFRTITPLERPEELGEQERFGSAEAAAEFEQRTLARRDKDRRTSDGLSAQADVANAYNQFWWDYGDKLTEDRRTSLIVDPPTGGFPN